jgi:hypothetical protein
MMEDLEQGDVAATIKQFFEAGKHCLPLSKSTLSLQEVSLSSNQKSITSNHFKNFRLTLFWMSLQLLGLKKNRRIFLRRFARGVPAMTFK